MEPGTGTRLFVVRATRATELTLYRQSMTSNPADGTGTARDVIIIGAGQARGPLTGALARSRRRVTLIEKSHVGGTA